MGEDLLAGFGWGAVFFKVQAAVLLRGEEARGGGVDPHARPAARIAELLPESARQREQKQGNLFGPVFEGF